MGFYRIVLLNDHRNINSSNYGRENYPYQVSGINNNSKNFEINYLYDCKDNRNYKSNIVDGQELNSSYYLTDAMGHTLAIKNLKDSLGVKLETWAYFLFGTQREAKLNLSSMNESHMFQSNEVTFYIYDHLGNTRLTHTPGVTGGASACMAYTYIDYLAEYFPYGKVLREYIPNEQERYMTTMHACPTKDFRRIRDKETELDYRGARYYDSDVARFLSLDPLANKFPAWSAYNYVMGNPVMFIDPDGRESTPPPSGNPLRWIAEAGRRVASEVSSWFTAKHESKSESGYRTGGKGAVTEVFSGAIFKIQTDFQSFFEKQTGDFSDIIEMSNTVYEGSRVSIKSKHLTFETEVIHSEGNTTTTSTVNGQFNFRGVPINSSIYSITDRKGNEIKGGKAGIGTKKNNLFLQLNQETKDKISNTNASIGVSTTSQSNSGNGQYTKYKSTTKLQIGGGQ